MDKEEVIFLTFIEEYSSLTLLNPALTEPLPMEFHWEQIQIHGLFKLISFISFICNNRSPPITENKANTYKSRAGGQGPYLRSLDHLGRSSEV